MKIVLIGATGFIGMPLCWALARAGHELVVLARDPERAAAQLPKGTEVPAWRSDGDGEWTEALAQTDAVVNLAGESIGGRRWSPEVKQRLRSSRIDTTRTIVEALRKVERPEIALLNASAVGYYGDTGDRVVTEESGPGDGFLAQLCTDWEAEACRAEEFGHRVVRLRTGVVLGEGGALEKMVLPFRLFVGGPLGSGRQWMPWILLIDAVGMIVWALENAAVTGPLNVCAPTPVTMRELAHTLGRVLHRPSFFPVPAFALRLMVGEFAEYLLAGQRALPQTAQKLGYRWQYPDLEEALRAVLIA